MHVTGVEAHSRHGYGWLGLMLKICWNRVWTGFLARS